MHFYPFYIPCAYSASELAAIASLIFFPQGFQWIGGTLVRRVIFYLGSIHSVGFHQYPRIGYPPLGASDTPRTTDLREKIWR